MPSLVSGDERPLDTLMDGLSDIPKDIHIPHEVSILDPDSDAVENAPAHLARPSNNGVHSHTQFEVISPVSGPQAPELRKPALHVAHFTPSHMVQLRQWGSELKHLRERRLEVLSQQIHAAASYKESVRHASETLAAVRAQIRSAPAESRLTVEDDFLKSKSCDLDQDYEVLETIIDSMIKSNSKLGFLDLRITQLESLLLQEIHLALPASACDEAVEQARTGSSESIPNLAEEYFNCAGSLDGLEEQLLDMERDHFREQSNRERLRDQDGDVANSDAEFEGRYQARRAELSRDIACLSAKKLALRAQCERENINLDQLRFREFERDSHLAIQSPNLAREELLGMLPSHGFFDDDFPRLDAAVDAIDAQPCDGYLATTRDPSPFTRRQSIEKWRHKVDPAQTPEMTDRCLDACRYPAPSTLVAASDLVQATDAHPADMENPAVAKSTRQRRLTA